jgi:preprotein translocase subunit SecG
MFTAIAILMMIASILLVLAVLAQNSKGGGLAAGFSAGTQIMGVRRTTDIIEKITWGLAISLFVLSVGAAFFLPKNQGATGPASAIQEQIDQSTVPINQAPPLPTDQNQE